MKITVFGATGRTGVPLVKQALERGHEVTAVVRSEAKLKGQQGDRAGLIAVEGDARDAAVAARVVSGSDAVVSVIGHGKGTPSDLLTAVSKNISAAMRGAGVVRLISLTGGAVHADADRPKLIDKVLDLLLKVISPRVLRDARAHALEIQQSGLDWTIVRAQLLTDTAATGKYRVGYIGKDSGLKIPRGDVADFILNELETNRYVRDMPMISS